MDYQEIAVTHTRKPTSCVWCGEQIEEGLPSVGRTYRFCGEFVKERLHPECMAALRENVYAADGGGYEFMPGDHARGRTDDKTRQPPEFTADGQRSIA